MPNAGYFDAAGKLDPNAWLDNANEHALISVYDLLEHKFHQSLTPQIPLPPLTPTQSPPSLFKAL